jgi:hypothetical protein
MSNGSKLLLGLSLAAIGYLVYRKYMQMKNEIEIQKARAVIAENLLKGVVSVGEAALPK